MPEFEVILADQAPRPPATLSRRLCEYDDFVRTLRGRQVGKLMPEGSETSRALASRVSRASHRIGRRLTVWTADGVVYFTLA